MTRVLGLDFEANGLCTKTSRITEIGACLWDVETKRPLTTIGVFLHDDSYEPLSEEIIRLTGITDEILKEFGTSPADNLKWLDGYCYKHNVEYIVGHNGEGYDKPLLLAELERNKVEAKFLKSLQWVDTKTDIPFASPPDSTKLKYLAGDHGFLNPFAHRAVFDVLTMLRVMSNYEFSAILEYKARPSVVVRAVVPHPKHDNGVGKDKAKACGFRWQQIDYKTYPLQWVKRIKEDQLEAERARLPEYQLVVLKD